MSRCVATAPTARGIETLKLFFYPQLLSDVATAPTARGIETLLVSSYDVQTFGSCNNTYRLRY